MSNEQKLLSEDGYAPISVKVRYYGGSYIARTDLGDSASTGSAIEAAARAASKSFRKRCELLGLEPPSDSSLEVHPIIHATAAPRCSGVYSVRIKNEHLVPHS